MTRIDGAMERFQLALDRVERAVSESAVSPDTSDPQKTLEESARLAAELEQIKSNYNTLLSVTDQVETRLDTAIVNIRRMMQG